MYTAAFVLLCISNIDAFIVCVIDRCHKTADFMAKLEIFRFTVTCTAHLTRNAEVGWIPVKEIHCIAPAAEEETKEFLQLSIYTIMQIFIRQREVPARICRQQGCYVNAGRTHFG